MPSPGLDWLMTGDVTRASDVTAADVTGDVIRLVIWGGGGGERAGGARGGGYS